MAGEFWLSDRQRVAIEPLLPSNQPGARRTDDRRVSSGIVHMLRNGGRWQDCPSCLRPADHDLQPLSPLVRSRGSGKACWPP